VGWGGRSCISTVPIPPRTGSLLRSLLARHPHRLVRLLEHCVQGQGHPRLSGACMWGAAPAHSCMRTHVPSLETPHPTPVGALWSTQPERARPCMHACMHRGSVQQRPAGKEEAHAFARLPRGYKLCALAACTPARARGRGRSETVGIDVRGGCRTSRDKGIIAEQVPGLERGFRDGSARISFPFPLPTPAPSPRRTCSGAWQRRRGGGKALPEHGNFPWRACAATRAAGRWRRRCVHTVPGKTGRGKWQGGKWRGKWRGKWQV
jgi:hypothetical protein